MKPLPLGPGGAQEEFRVVARQPRRRQGHRPTRVRFPETFDLFLKALEADLGLAPVEKYVHNIFS